MQLIIRTVAALGLAATAATAASALDLNSARFVRAGYAVEAHYGADKSMELVGRNPTTKSKFRLMVTRDNHVTGTWDGQAVDTYVGAQARTETASISGQ